MSKTYHVVIEQDEDNLYIGRVPELKGCVSQGNTVEELISNMKEAISLYIETTKDIEDSTRFVGIEQIEVA